MPLNGTDSPLSSSSPAWLTEPAPDSGRASSRVAQRGDLSLRLEVPDDRVAAVGASSQDVRDVRVPCESGDVVDRAGAGAGGEGLVGCGEVPDVDLRERVLALDGRTEVTPRTSPFVAPEARRFVW